MLIDGEKYACDACVRGHRVSNCNHYERPLTHINKKGRPVSQCPHCRGLRKARSSHVKCECGEKAHSKNVNASPDKAGIRRPKACSCSHGTPCTCAVKKDPRSMLSEKNSTSLTRSRSHTDGHRPVPTFHADAPMNVFQNGHHKPIHHRNHAAQDCGRPYKIPRPHSIHGNPLAQSSTDSLPLLSTPYDMLIHEDHVVHSEHGSPAMHPKIDLLNQLPQLDLTYGALNTDIASSVSSPVPEEMGQGPSSAGFPSYLSGIDDQPLSAMSGPPVDWASMDLPLGGNNLPVDYNQARSYTSYDQPPMGHPGLKTTTSSGEVSDAEDYMGNVHSPAIYCGSPYLSPPENNVMGSYNMSSDSLGSMTSPQQQQPPPSSVLLSGNLAAPASLDNFLSSGMSSPRDFGDYSANQNIEQDPYGNLSMAIQDMQKLSHAGLGIDAGRGPSPPAFRPTSDPSWAGSFPQDEAVYIPTSAPFQQQQHPQQAAWTSC